jgi:hypothetical protein
MQVVVAVLIRLQGYHQEVPVVVVIQELLAVVLEVQELLILVLAVVAVEMAMVALVVLVWLFSGCLLLTILVHQQAHQR